MLTLKVKGLINLNIYQQLTVKEEIKLFPRNRTNLTNKDNPKEASQAIKVITIISR